MRRIAGLAAVAAALAAPFALHGAAEGQVDADGIPKGTVPCWIEVSADVTDRSPGRLEHGVLTEHTRFGGKFASYCSYSEKGTESPYSHDFAKAAKSSTYGFMIAATREGGQKASGTWRYDSTDTSEGPGISSDLRVTETGVPKPQPMFASASATFVTTGDPDVLFCDSSGFALLFTTQRKSTWTDIEVRGESKPGTIDRYDRSDSSAGEDTKGFTPFAFAEGEAKSKVPFGSEPKLEPVLKLSRKALHDALTSKKPSTVSATAHYSYEYERPGRGKKKTKVRREATCSFRVTFHARPLEAVIEPVGKDKLYPGWIPRGPLPLSSETAGNEVAFSVRLIDPKNPDGPPPDVQYRTIWYLDHVSKNIGTCMNFPQRDDASCKNAGKKSEPDLRFDEKPNAGIGTISADGCRLETKDGCGDRSVVVTSYDWGAYGEILADVQVGDQLIRAKAGVGPLPDAISIPKDDDQNHIADRWEIDNGLFERNLPPTWDGEAEPRGANDGDGITLYEEYRGFVLEETQGKRAYTRMVPKTKKLFVCPIGDIRDMAVAAVTSFEKVSGLEAHYVAEEDLGVRAKDSARRRWLNFDAVKGLPELDPVQCAVRIERVAPSEMSGHLAPARTSPIAGHLDLVPTPPMDVERVMVCPEAAAHDTDVLLATLRGATDDSMPNTRRVLANFGIKTLDEVHALAKDVEKRRGELDAQFTAYTLLHELGHAVGLMHHGIKAQVAGSPALPDENSYYALGDHTCIMCYWQCSGPNYLVPFHLGIWNPAGGALDIPSADCVAHPVENTELKWAAWHLCTKTGGFSEKSCRKMLRLHW